MKLPAILKSVAPNEHDLRRKHLTASTFPTRKWKISIDLFLRTRGGITTKIWTKSHRSYSLFEGEKKKSSNDSSHFSIRRIMLRTIKHVLHFSNLSIFPSSSTLLLSQSILINKINSLRGNQNFFRNLEYYG